MSNLLTLSFYIVPVSALFKAVGYQFPNPGQLGFVVESGIAAEFL
jgi:hypothetical protein